MKIFLIVSFIFSIINCSFKINKIWKENILKANGYHNNLRILQTTTSLTITPETTSLTTTPETTSLTTTPETTSLTTTPETTSLTTSLVTTELTAQPSSNETNHPEKYILLGFKNNSEVKDDSLIQFYAYVKIININKDIHPQNTFTLKANVNKDKTKLRFLEEIVFECTNNEEKKEDGIYNYTCENDTNGLVESIYLDDIKFELGPYAYYTNNLKNGDLFDLLKKKTNKNV